MGKTRMRMLIITWNFPPKRGGMENLLYDIYSHLSQVYTIQVIAPMSSDSDSEDNAIYRPGFGGFIPFILFSFFKGIRLLNKNRADIILGGSLAVLPVVVLLKLVFRVKSIVYAHGLDIIYNNSIYQTMLKVCAPLMDGVLCNSHNTRDLLAQKMPKIKNVAVIPPGVDIQDEPDRTARPYPRKYLLSVGRLVPRKGLTGFIAHCFRHIAEKHDDVDLLIVGEEPGEAMFHQAGYRQEIIDCIFENGLQERVHLLGWVDETRKMTLYRFCECLVFPVIPIDDDVEGFGIVAIEAGIMGRPTVAFNVGGIADAIDQKAGVLIEAMDYQSMTQEIDHIIAGQQFSDSASISKAVKEHYSWSRTVHEYIIFINKIAGMD